MDELNSGKKTKEVATDLHISKSSVRRCAKKAKAEGGGEMASRPRAAEASASRWRLLRGARADGEPSCSLRPAPTSPTPPMWQTTSAGPSDCRRAIHLLARRLRDRR